MCAVLNGWQEREIVVPVKLYQAEDRMPQILVLWINESELGGQPLLATNRILNQMFEKVSNPERLKISMIGPSDSGVLEQMAEEMKSLNVAAEATKNDQAEAFGLEGNEPAIHWLISSYGRDAKSVQGFTPLLSLPTFDQGIDLFSCRATKSFEKEWGDELLFPEHSPVKLHRIIGTDLQLAYALKEELKIRGALQGRVALISEHDTAYGRAIKETFEKAFGTETEFQTFKILRGIDGKRPNGNGASNGSNHNSQESGRDSSMPMPKIVERPPEGRSQYDYLRRLARRIEDASDVAAIKAIGVVGSDVYDKLLVLRALRPKFPNCVFFTTDLDAIYRHADERQHTRNLLVASHFALSLGETLQPQTPPFRDSYQTATFLATRLAVRDGQRHFDALPAGDGEKEWERVDEHCLGDHPRSKAIQPVLHVVGRNQLHQLSPPQREAVENRSSAVTSFGLIEPVESILHPRITHNAAARHYLFAFGVAFVACCFVWWQRLRERSLISPLGQEQRHRSLRSALVIVFVGGWCLVAIFVYRAVYGLEAAAIVAGYSTWPTKLLYSLVGIAAVGAVAHLIDQWYRQLNEIRMHSGQVSRRACRWFGEQDNLKLGILAVVIAYVAGVAVCPLDTWHFWLAASAMIGVLALVWGYRTNKGSRDHATDPWLNVQPNRLVLGRGVRAMLGSALMFMVAVTIAHMASAELLNELWANQPISRWHPAYFSRGLFSRQGDWVASIYGFGAVGLLLASLIYLQVWCREFADHVLRHDDQERDAVEQMRVEFAQQVSEEDLAMELKNQYDRLWAIGKLTATTGKLVPMLLALLFVLVVAYHPWISPVSMPASLLVLATIYVVVFVVSRLSLRWSMHRERDSTLDQLDLRCSELYDPMEEIATSQQEIRHNAGGIPGQVRIRVEELLQAVGEDGVRASATTTALKAERHETKPDQREQMKKLLKARREQIANLSDGVFQSWNRSPMGWILGGGTTLALLDLWIRWWTIGI